MANVQQIENAIRRRHYGAFGKSAIRTDSSGGEIDMMLHFELENLIVAFQGWEKQALPLLEKARAATTKWRIENYKRKQLRRALRRSYKCGRKALAAVKLNPSTANFHELRKQVKLLGYQLRIIEPLNRVVVGRVTDELTELGHLLGRVHDLCFLGDRLRWERDEPEWQKGYADLLDVIKSSQAELERDALEFAERFFAERPRDFALLIEEWFEDQESADANSIARELIVTHTNHGACLQAPPPRTRTQHLRRKRQVEVGVQTPELARFNHADAPDVTRS